MAVRGFRTPRDYPKPEAHGPRGASAAHVATCPFCGTAILDERRLCRGCQALRGAKTPEEQARAYWAFTAPFLLFCSGLAGCVYLLGRDAGGWILFCASLAVVAGVFALRALPRLFRALREDH